MSRGDFMISYDPFWKTIKEKGLTKYKLRAHHGISSSTLLKMKRNGYLNLNTVENFCKLLNCKIEDIVEYIPDKE